MAEQAEPQENNDHAFIRKANYYGGNENEITDRIIQLRMRVFAEDYRKQS